MTSSVVLTWDDDEGAVQFAGIFRELGRNGWQPGGPAAFRILAETATVTTGEDFAKRWMDQGKFKLHGTITGRIPRDPPSQ